MAKSLALVTGASSGIGRAIALRLARDGFEVIVHYRRDEAGARSTLDAILSAGGTGRLAGFDVRDAPAAEAVLEREIPVDRGLDALVNNSGIHRDMLTGLMSDEAFDDVLRTNAYGAFYLMRWASRRMLRQRRGSIVNIVSLAGQTGNPGQLNYAASKAAVIAMTKTLALEIGSRGVRVNAVAPGFIETPMLDELKASGRVAEMLKHVPLGRVGKPEDVAGAVSFLCSDDAAYVTGHTLSVNGGLYCT